MIQLIDSGQAKPGEWDAAAYHRLSDPQFQWGRQILSRLELRGDETVLDAGCGTGRLTAELMKRLPEGRVIAVDVSENMLTAAREFLRPRAGNRLRFVQADLGVLELDERVDGVFSTATFHWIPDHARLFSKLFQMLRPGGWLVAQFGGQGNIECWRRRMAVLAGQLPFVTYIRDWVEEFHFPDTKQTAERLKRAGFASVEVESWPSPVSFADPDSFGSFLGSVIARNYLARLDENLQREFMNRLIKQAGEDAPPFLIDYVRLNVRAVRPE
jgi:trans-aconitate 2-methyltransferase